ncbi:MAG: DUF2797 domain-containing protein [Promethearchaeota archaeon]
MTVVSSVVDLSYIQRKCDIRIRNYFWKEFMDFYAPCLYMKSKYHHFSCILHGSLYFRLGDHFCVECGAHIAPFTFLSLCDACLQNEDTAKFLCILKGAGAPYEKQCNLDDPPCHDLYRRDSFCQTEHLVYIGRFGSLFKAGVTRKSRKEFSGMYSRLLEQGLDEALIISQGLTLPEAQRLEAKVSALLNVPKWISFAAKAESIIANVKKKLSQEEPLTKMDAIRTKLARFVPEDTISHVIVDHAYMMGYINPDSIEWITRPEQIEGEVAVIKGNVLITRLDSKYLVYDLAKLQGREILLGD